MRWLWSSASFKRVAGVLVTLVAGFALTGHCLGQDDLTLVYPKVQDTSSSQVGLALANNSDHAANLEVFFLSYSGELIAFRAETSTCNPLTIGPRKQISLLLTDSALFCPEFEGAAKGQEGILLIFSDNIAVVGFFLTFNSDVSRIDGAEAFVLATVSDTIIFPELFVAPGQNTKFNVIVVDQASVNVLFELIGPSGSVKASKSLQVPAGPFGIAALSKTATDVFGTAAAPSDYVRASCPSGLIGYQDFGGSNFLGGRNAIFSSMSREMPVSLFGAQAARTAAISTQLTLINSGDEAADLEVSLFPTGGVQQGETLEALATAAFPIPAGGIVRDDLGDLLSLDGDFVGWIRVDSNKTGIIGDVTFGDSGGNFLSSVQLQSSPLSDIVFSHIADGFGFFTGLTFLNIRPDAVDVSIDVFSVEGIKKGSDTFQLLPFEHRPGLIPQFVEGLPSQIGGFIQIHAPLGVISFELFGYAPTGVVRSMAAVPPQRGHGTMSGQIFPAEFQASALTESLLQQVQSQVTLARPYPASRAKKVLLDPEQEFRPGEAIVKFRSGASAQAESAVRSLLGLRSLSASRERVSLVASDRVERPGIQALAAMDPGEVGRLKSATLDLIEALNGDPAVEYAQPNYIYRATVVTPNDPYFDLQWHYNQIGLPEAWEITKGGSGVVVAVIDSGVKFDHPDFRYPGPVSRFTSDGYDFISDPQVALDGDGMDSNADDPGDDPLGLSSSYHGTHVAGTIGAASNNGIGGAGVNWVSKMMALRALGAGGGSSWDIYNALLYAVGLPNSSGQFPSQAARVINMSLGGLGAGPFEVGVVADAVERAFIVAAAGNNNSDVPFYPAALDGVIGISAVDLSGTKAPYSNYGTNIDFAAPGGNTGADVDLNGLPDGVLSALWDDSADTGSYELYQGTSMAAPHVAGVISLMLSVNPGLGLADVEFLLQQSAIDLGTAGKDQFYGWGLIDALGAVSLAAGGASEAPRLVANPSALDFSTTLNQLTVSLYNAGGGSLTVNAPSVQTDSGGSWLSAVVTAQPLGGSPGRLTVTVNRQMVGADGEYTGRIGLTSTNNGGSATVEVRMYVGNPVDEDICGGADCVYVLAIDPRTFDSVGQAVATFAGVDERPDTPEDEYTFFSTPIPSGNYLVYAGTDLDGDNRICDDGEFCGIYPVSSRPSLVNIQSGDDTSGISFTIEKDLFGTSVGDQKQGFSLIWKDFSQTFSQKILKSLEAIEK